MMLGLPTAAVLGTCLAAAGGPVYPEWIYPTQVLEAARTSEVPFEETAETLRYGFNQPFPDGPRRSFRVDDYGAVPDGVTDCTGAFYAALAAARATQEPAEVVFARPGRYYLRAQRDQGTDELAVLRLDGVRNLVVRGQGVQTVLMIGEPALGGLWVSHGDTVMLRDFALDYNPLPFTQGRVVALDAGAGTFVLRVGEGYPTPAEVKAALPEVIGGYRLGSARDGAYKWPAITPLFAHSPQLVSGRDWRFQVDPKALKGYMALDDEFIYVGRRFAQMGLGASDSRAFYVRNVTVFAATTTGLSLQRVEGALIDGYRDVVPPGSNRLLASNADAIWNCDVAGGITVRNCSFRGQGDDHINLHCLALLPAWVSQVSDTELALQVEAGARPGDRLEVCDPHQGKIKGHVAIAAVSREPGAKGPRLRLAGSLRAAGYDPRTDYLYNTDWAAPNFKIVHNYFGPNRSRCLLIQARGGLIEANTLENAEGYGVLLGYCATSCPEGLIPREVAIRRNVFRNLTGTGLSAAIDVVDGSEFRNYRDLVIAGNRFINPRKMAIRVTGCDGLQVLDNEAATETGRRNTWNHPVYYPVDCSLYLENCAHAVVDGFRVRDSGITECAVYVGKQCAAGPEGVVLKHIEARLAPGVPVLKDLR